MAISTVRPLDLNSLNISCLNEEEKRKLSLVLERNNRMVNHENCRLSRMNNEIKEDIQCYSQKQNNHQKTMCLECSKDMKDFDGCEKCNRKVCQNCCKKFGNHDVLLCKICYREMVLEAKSAKWFYEKNQKEKHSEDPTETVMASRIVSEERLPPVSSEANMDYKNLVENMASKFCQIDEEVAKTSNSRPGFKKTYGKSADLKPKDKVQPPDQQDVSNPENKAMMNEFIEKIIELNQQYMK